MRNDLTGFRLGGPVRNDHNVDLNEAMRRSNPRALDAGVHWSDIWSWDAFIRTYTGEIREGNAGQYERDVFSIYNGALPLEFIATGTMRRDVGTSQLTTGGALVASDPGTRLAEALRPSSVIARLGASYLPGLVGEYPLPRVAAGATAAFVPEGTPYNEVTPSLGSVLMTPHDVGAYCDLTRRARKQAPLLAERMIRRDLAAAIITEMDRVALHGSGLDGEPVGVAASPGIGSVTAGGVPTYGKLIDLYRAVSVADADGASVAFITTPSLQAVFLATSMASGEGSIWQPPTVAGADGSIAGRAAYASGAVSDTLGAGGNLSAIFCGHWENLVVGLWGGLEINLDHSTMSTTGTVRIVMSQAMDIGLRHPAAFAAILDAALA